jgi:hypothetical protein
VCAKRVTRDAEDGVTASAAGRARSQVCVVLEEVTWQAGVNSRQPETSHPSSRSGTCLDLATAKRACNVRFVSHFLGLIEIGLATFNAWRIHNLGRV